MNLITISDAKYLEPLVVKRHATDPGRGLVAYSEADGYYYEIQKTCRRASTLQRLGINYPICIEPPEYQSLIDARQVRLKESRKLPPNLRIKVQIDQSGFLMLVDFPLSHDYFEPSGDSVITQDDYILFSEKLRSEYILLQELLAEYHIPPNIARSVVVAAHGHPPVRPSGHSSYLHRSLVSQLKKLHPPEYYDFVKDLEYTPKVIKPHYTKEELLRYDQLCREGYTPILNEDHIKLRGSNLAMSRRPLVNQYIKEKKPQISLCDQILYYPHLNREDIIEIKSRLAEEKDIKKCLPQLSLELLLMLKEEYLERVLDQLPVYERLSILELLV